MALSQQEKNRQRERKRKGRERRRKGRERRREGREKRREGGRGRGFIVDYTLHFINNYLRIIVWLVD